MRILPSDAAFHEKGEGNPEQGGGQDRTLKELHPDEPHGQVEPKKLSLLARIRELFLGKKRPSELSANPAVSPEPTSAPTERLAPAIDEPLAGGLTPSDALSNAMQAGRGKCAGEVARAVRQWVGDPPRKLSLRQIDQLRTALLEGGGAITNRWATLTEDDKIGVLVTVAGEVVRSGAGPEGLGAVLAFQTKFDSTNSLYLGATYSARAVALLITNLGPVIGDLRAPPEMLDEVVKHLRERGAGAECDEVLAALGGKQTSAFALDMVYATFTYEEVREAVGPILGETPRNLQAEWERANARRFTRMRPEQSLFINPLDEEAKKP